jgi:hydroxyacylglutathione hydrolase
MILNLPIGIVASNCIVIFDEITKKGAVVDPGILSLKPLQDVIQKYDIDIIFVLNTHGHFDHTAGNNLLCPPHLLAIHPDDENLLMTGGGASLFGLGSPPPSPSPDLFLHHEDILSLGEMQLKVIHTPGHTAGSVSFYIKQEDTLITGDTLFQGSVGRTDLPGGNEKQLMSSLARYLSLPDITIVLPGHGPASTMGAEKQYNPWLHSLVK